MTSQEKLSPQDIVAAWTSEEVHNYVSQHYAQHLLSRIGKKNKTSYEDELMRCAINKIFFLAEKENYDQIGLYIPKTTHSRK